MIGTGALAARVDSGLTLLMIAGLTGNVEMVKLLLDHGANRSLASRQGKTPLMLATDPAIVRLPKERGGEGR